MDTAYFIVLLLFTLSVHIILYILSRFDVKKGQELKMIENAANILSKIDEIKKTGGPNKMDENLKKLAKYLSNKINEAKEEILENIDTRFDELTESNYEEHKEEEFEEPEDDLDKEFEEEDIKEEKDSLFDVSKRQINSDMENKEPEKKEKKGLFGRKKKDKNEN